MKCENILCIQQSEVFEDRCGRFEVGYPEACKIRKRFNRVFKHHMFRPEVALGIEKDKIRKGKR